MDIYTNTCRGTTAGVPRLTYMFKLHVQVYDELLCTALHMYSYSVFVLTRKCICILIPMHHAGKYLYFLHLPYIVLQFTADGELKKELHLPPTSAEKMHLASPCSE